MNQGLLFILFLIVLTSACDTVSQLLLKLSINSLDLHVNTLRRVLGFVFQLIRIPRLRISLIFSAFSLFIWLFVLSRVDLNFAFSLDSMHYIFIALGSMWFLKEKVGFVRWLGIFSIIFGIVLVSLS